MNAGLLKKEEIKKEAMWSPRESLRLRVVCYLLLGPCLANMSSARGVASGI